jgi:hypothetical protein
VKIPINQRTTLKISMANMKIEEMREKIKGKESIKGNKLTIINHTCRLKKECCGFSNNSFEYHVKYFMYNVFQ